MSSYVKLHKALPLSLLAFVLSASCDAGFGHYEYALDPGTSEAAIVPQEGATGPDRQPPDEMTIEEQEKLVSEMMDMIIEAKWYLKKIGSSSAAVDARQEKILSEVESRISALNNRKKMCAEKKWLTDPACKSKFSEEIVPGLVDVNTKWQGYLRNHFPLTLFELYRLRDDLKAQYQQNNFEEVLTRFKLIQAKIGAYYFDCAKRLDPDFSAALLEIQSIHEQAESARKNQRRSMSRWNGDSSKETYAYLVNIVPKIGTKYEAVIKDAKVLALLENNKLLDLKRLDPDSMLTLHYMRGMNGTTAVKVKDIQFLTAILPLTRSQLEEVKGAIGRRIEKSNREEAARLEALRKKNAERAEREAAEEQERIAEAARKKAEEDRFKLLNRFPPDQGWGKERKEEIERRRIVLNVFPNKEEQAFLDHFEEWSRQYEDWKALKEKESGAPR